MQHTTVHVWIEHSITCLIPCNYCHYPWLVIGVGLALSHYRHHPGYVLDIVISVKTGSVRHPMWAMVNTEKLTCLVCNVMCVESNEMGCSLHWVSVTACLVVIRISEQTMCLAAVTYQWILLTVLSQFATSLHQNDPWCTIWHVIFFKIGFTSVEWTAPCHSNQHSCSACGALCWRVYGNFSQHKKELVPLPTSVLASVFTSTCLTFVDLMYLAAAAAS